MATAPVTATGERFPFAGFFRAAAIFLIVAYHAWLTDINAKPAEAPGLISLAMFGSFAVACFFALTGFLLGLPFLRAYRDGTERPSWRAFARNRILRIYPLYVFAIVFALLTASWIRQGDRAPTAFDVFTHLTMIHTWFPSSALAIDPPLWTMATDAQFYVLLPILMAFMWRLGGAAPRDRVVRAATLFGAGIVLAIAARWELRGQAHHAYNDFAYRIALFGQVPTMFVAFGGGVLVALAWMSARPEQRSRFGAIAAVVALAPLLLALNQLPPGELATVVFNDVLDALAACLLLFAGLCSPSALWAHGPFVWAERLSYGVYVFHFAVLKVVAPLMLPLSAWPFLLLTTVVVYALALVLALPAYYAIEAPFLRMKRRAQAPASGIAAAARSTH